MVRFANWHKWIEGLFGRSENEASRRSGYLSEFFVQDIFWRYLKGVSLQCLFREVKYWVEQETFIWSLKSGRGVEPYRLALERVFYPCSILPPEKSIRVSSYYLKVTDFSTSGRRKYNLWWHKNVCNRIIKCQSIQINNNNNKYMYNIKKFPADKNLRPVVCPVPVLGLHYLVCATCRSDWPEKLKFRNSKFEIWNLNPNSIEFDCCFF